MNRQTSWNRHISGNQRVHGSRRVPGSRRTFGLLLPTLLAALSLLPSCASAPDPAPLDVEFDLPLQWSASALPEGEIADQWWEQLAPELQQLVAEALVNSPTLAAAATRIDGALAQATIAGADAFPQLSGSFEPQRRKTQFFSPFSSDPLVDRRTTYSLSLNLNWELDLWGRVRSGKAAAIADAQAIEAAYYGARTSLIGQVAKAYFIAVERQQQLNIARSNLDSVRSLSDRIEDRYRSGLRSAFDVKLTRGDLANRESRLAVAEQQFSLAKRQLEILLGRYPTGTITLTDPLPQELELVPAGLPAEILARRPDLVEAERRAAAAAERADSAQAARLPRISITASGGTVTEDIADLLDEDFGVWNLAGNLLAPLFQGGRLQAEANRQLAAEQEALASYVAVALSAFAEVENALASAGYLEEAQEALGRAVTASESSLEIAQDRYFNGVFDILDVLSAQRSYFDAQSALLSTQLERVNNRIDLHLALGGGFRGLVKPEASEETTP